MNCSKEFEMFFELYMSRIIKLQIHVEYFGGLGQIFFRAFLFSIIASHNLNYYISSKFLSSKIVYFIFAVDVFGHFICNRFMHVSLLPFLPLLIVCLR